MQDLFEKWLINNHHPKRYAKTIVTISNDLKKVAYTNSDLFSISSSVEAKQVKNDYFKIDEYFNKNSRGHNMYSSAFERYIEFLEDILDTNIIYSDELENQILLEGAKKEVIVNSYERNPVARQECIKYYGAKCFICNFDFEKIYVKIGKGFIYVHYYLKLTKNIKLILLKI